MIATRAANEICLHLIKLCLYIAFGLFTLKVLSLGLLVAIVATMLMKHIHAQHPGANQIVIEKVCSLKKVSDEAYYYDTDNHLLKKSNFHEGWCCTGRLQTGYCSAHLRSKICEYFLWEVYQAICTPLRWLVRFTQISKQSN